MPIYELDKEKSLSEPIVIVIEGKKLTIKDCGKKDFDKISTIGDPHEQLAAWARIPKKDAEKFPMRKVAAALRIIAKELLTGITADIIPNELKPGDSS